VSRPQDTPAYIARLYDEAVDPVAAPVVYSDLNYILLGYAIARATGVRLDQLAQKEIFAPLGLQRTMFNPPHGLQREIAATEHGQAFEQANALCDAQLRGIEGATELPPREWRNSVIWGEVHDGNAHFLGGIAGHAGLFSTAREVFQIANQFLPGSRLVQPESLRLFTENLTADRGTSRSIGWIVASGSDCSAGPVLPKTAIGHNGFTGTSVWMVPEQRRVFVLLTNRIHPRVSTIEMKTVRQRFNTLAVEELNRS
jgi:CubicO group peptidase (beta-lactamase class C family)